MAGGALCVSAHVARRGKGSVVGERAWKKAGKRCVAMGAAAAPSRGVGTELAALERWSEILPDSSLAQGPPPEAKSGNVCPSFLDALASQPERSVFHQAMERAFSAQECFADAGSRASCVVDHALANVGTEMARRVSGRVSTAIDITNNCESVHAIIEKVRFILGLYAELGVTEQKLLVRLPCTYQGLQACRSLEAEGIQVLLDSIFSKFQAAEAIKAGASVIEVNAARLKQWHEMNPGVIVDAHSPRQDSGAGVPYDVGLHLVSDAVGLAHSLADELGMTKRTKVIASGVRSRQDALSLAGCDYLVLQPNIIEDLRKHASDEGYSDDIGLTVRTGMERKLPEKRLVSFPKECQDVKDEKSYNSLLPMAARSLLDDTLKNASACSKRVRKHFERMSGTANV